jgi:hypothetical protein
MPNVACPSEVVRDLYLTLAPSVTHRQNNQRSRMSGHQGCFPSILAGILEIVSTIKWLKDV